jgi:hypothetical protein
MIDILFVLPPELCDKPAEGGVRVNGNPVTDPSSNTVDRCSDDGGGITTGAPLKALDETFFKAAAGLAAALALGPRS